MPAGWLCVPVCRMLRPATASPPGGLPTCRAQEVKAAQVVGEGGEGALAWP